MDPDCVESSATYTLNNVPVPEGEESPVHVIPISTAEEVVLVALQQVFVPRDQPAAKSGVIGPNASTGSEDCCQLHTRVGGESTI
jgi:hypothetical protein